MPPGIISDEYYQAIRHIVITESCRCKSPPLIYHPETHSVKPPAVAAFLYVQHYEAHHLFRPSGTLKFLAISSYRLIGVEAQPVRKSSINKQRLNLSGITTSPTYQYTMYNRNANSQCRQN